MIKVLGFQIPKIEQVIREVKVKQIVDRPFDVLIHKPKIETKIVEQIKEVPGEVGGENTTLKYFGLSEYFVHASIRDCRSVLAVFLMTMVVSSTL